MTLCLSVPQILWEITRFFLLAIELSVIILGLAFGMCLWTLAHSPYPSCSDSEMAPRRRG